jgi:hypothetical protein
MSFPYAANVQDEKLESLHNQYEYLKLLRLRHLQWLTSAEKSEIENVHRQIAELIELTTDRYNRLLESLQQSGEAKAGTELH